jgi:hypothetical protein
MRQSPRSEPRVHRGVARDQQAEKIGGRGAYHEQARCVLRKPEQFGGPSRDLPLHFDADVIAAAAIGIEPGGEHFGDHADRRSRAMHPAHEQRMGVADAIGLDVRFEIFKHFGKFARAARQRRLKMLTNVRRRFPPDGALARVAQKIDHPIQRLMAGSAKRLPVPRIEIVAHGRRSSSINRRHFSNSASRSRPHCAKAAPRLSPPTRRSAISLIIGALAQTRSAVLGPIATGCPR